MKRLLQEKDTSGCAIAGIMSERGGLLGGEAIIRCLGNMRERTSGLGAGFAGYGIYPEHRDHYAIHLMWENEEAKREAEAVLLSRCLIHDSEPIPTRPVDAIRSWPSFHRYFASVGPQEREPGYRETDDDVMVQLVMAINATVEGAFVLSSGRNMGVFKGVGYPEDIGAFFQLEGYRAYAWIGHGRFPTNTPGWWGGAHPFGLLDWAVVHNGEVSSYGINRRYLANFGYHCTLQTDTEVITYLFDLLVRKHGLPLDVACTALAPPFWRQIERMPEEERALARAVRIVYGGALLNGPFSVIVGHSGGMIGLNDRIKLRPMVAARKHEMLYIASEEAAVREVCRDPDVLWHAQGGVPIVGQLKSEGARKAEPFVAWAQSSLRT